MSVKNVENEVRVKMFYMLKVVDSLGEVLVLFFLFCFGFEKECFFFFREDIKFKKYNFVMYVFF